MASLTLSIPKDIRDKMQEHKHVNWSEVARGAILDKLALLQRMDKLLSHSKVSEDDAVEYGRAIKKRQWSKTKKML